MKILPSDALTSKQSDLGLRQPWRELLSDFFKFGNSKSANDAEQPGQEDTQNGKLLALLSSGRHYLLAAIVLSVALVLLLIVGNNSHASVRLASAHEEWLPADTTTIDNTVEKKRVIQLQSGDHAVAGLQRLGFDLATSRRMVAVALPVYNLRDIRAGQKFKRIDSADAIDVYYNISGEERLHLHQQKDQEWQCTKEVREVLTRQRVVAGTIDDSLFGAADQAGMDQRTTMNLVDIFAWDIDFARDMRSGDSFDVVYEEHFDDEGNILDTTILAAEFVNQGTHYRAVRYVDSSDKAEYFTPDGKSMRKAYLKAPVKFSRISSRFQTRRLHPVLGYTRAHRGVDYAAPTGTPIHAIGDGYVSFAGWKNGFGRFILITHNNRNHATAYGHMHGFARNIKAGVRVKQGQVIGYVGMSGLATGPHLHFEFRVRGVAVNPLTVKHPPAQPVAGREYHRFQQQVAPLLTELDELQAQATWG
ncbi:M23 family peptidase [Mariprofundus erugo]|uniref:M23 family peptidase n=1 Tax=Mariprofundus erugo TaxID=2528639 RepID=A0A5R9GNJ0_9PROT|nr:M23 family peptidase [Mariprofundus erugo]